MLANPRHGCGVEGHDGAGEGTWPMKRVYAGDKIKAKGRGVVVHACNFITMESEAGGSQGLRNYRLEEKQRTG